MSLKYGCYEHKFICRAFSPNEEVGDVIVFTSATCLSFGPCHLTPSRPVPKSLAVNDMLVCKELNITSIFWCILVNRPNRDTSSFMENEVTLENRLSPVFHRTILQMLFIVYSLLIDLRALRDSRVSHRPHIYWNDDYGDYFGE